MGAEATSEKRRSERVKLTVPLVVMTETLEHVKVQEVTQTVVVNAHGGLFKLKMEVLVGQPLTLTNLQTNTEQRCRVVRVEQLPGNEFGIAFEFDQPAPEFWPMSAPPADWSLPPS
jgi:PilZ domain